jgi:single-strand DNA-binding protein
VSLNKAMLIGNVGRDPEVRSTASGNKVANLSLATTEAWKDRDGERQERTEWHRVTVFGKLAEVVERWVRKGQMLYVEGQIRTRKYNDRDGVERYSTEIVVEIDGKLRMLGGKPENGEARPENAPGNQPVRGRRDDIDAPPEGDTRNTGGEGYRRGSFGMDLDDDDIPF